MRVRSCEERYANLVFLYVYVYVFFFFFFFFEEPCQANDGTYADDFRRP